MKLIFKKLSRKYFSAVRELALKGWLFAYAHLPKKELEKLVERYYSPRALERDLENAWTGKGLFILAFENKKLAGFCHVALRGKSGELCRLYTEPNRIGKGLGKKLLRRGEKFLKKRGAKKYFTFVNRHNRIGTNFYLRNGFSRNPKKDKSDEFESNALLYIEKKLD